MTNATELNLKVILAAKRKTMRDLANLTGYSYGHIRNICCGYQPSRKAHRKIEEVLCMNTGSIWSDLETETNTNKENKS